jgi:hypothetical protein
MSELDEVPKPAPPAEGQSWEQQVTGGENPEDLIPVVSPTGHGGTVKRKDLKSAIDDGFRLEHPEESHERALEKEYGDSPVRTAIEAGVSTATFGLSDLVGGEGMRERRKRNEGAAIVGGIAGAFVPGAGPLATGLGKAAGAAVKGTGLGARLAGAGVRGAAEGAVFGAGAGISQIGLTEGPVSWESAAATIGSNALGGAAIGGVIGGGAKLLEEGAVAAKALANRKLAQAAAPDAAAATRGEFPEIAGMDKKAAREAIVAEREVVRASRATELEAATAAKKAELATIETSKDAAADALFQEARAYKDSLKFIPVGDRELAKQLGNANRSMMRALDNPKGFVRQRASHGFVEGLEKQEAALSKVLGDADDVLARADVERQAMLDALPTKGVRPKAAAVEVAEELPFHAQVQEAAKRVTGPGKFGDRKVFISDVYEQMGGKAGSLDDFKAAVLKENQEGRLWLHRADLPEALDPARVSSSSIAHPSGVANMHFIELADSAATKAAGAADDLKFYLNPEQSKLYARFTGQKMAKGQFAIAVGADDLATFRAAIERGDLNPTSVQRVLDAQEMLQKNQELQGKIREIRSGAASDALAAAEQRIEAARAGLAKSPKLDALEAHLADLNDPSLGRKMAMGAGALAGGSIGAGVGGMFGAAAGGMVGREIGERVYDRLFKKIAAGNQNRAKAIAASVAGLFEKGAKTVARVAPLASKILPGIQYADPGYADRVLGPANERPSKSALVNDFRARARELNALTERTPDGGFTVRMQAREELNERLQGLWAVDPDFANGVEMTHNKRIEFLAGKLPRNPAPPHLQVGPDTWEPSRAELAKFARFMEAVEKPETVLQRMSTGTMTPEDAEVLKSVYPSMYEDARQQIQEHLVEARALPYQKRLALSIFMDVPADPAVTPEAITVYQGLYKQQMAQGQGGQPGAPASPPKAFKSSEKPTRAQNAGA